MIKREECDNCGAEATVTRGDIRFDEVGFPVLLHRVEVVKCAHCGAEEPIIPNFDGLMHAIALAVVCLPCKLSGEHVRFLRTYIGKSSAEFAELLHFHKTHMSKIENDHVAIGDQTDRLVRLLVVNLSPMLTKNIGELISMLPGIGDSESRCDIQIDPATRECEYA